MKRSRIVMNEPLPQHNSRSSGREAQSLAACLEVTPWEGRRHPWRDPPLQTQSLKAKNVQP